MRIVLIGFMGSGKSTIAALLAKKLEKNLVEMDQIVEQKAGMSIDKIFATGGEIAFREAEIAVAKELHNKDNCVISTGGGAIMNQIIIEYLREKSVIIFLKSKFLTSKKRIKKNPRILFRDFKKAKELYSVRLPLYRYYADYEIETDEKKPEEIVEEILKQL